MGTKGLNHINKNKKERTVKQKADSQISFLIGWALFFGIITTALIIWEVVR